MTESLKLRDKFLLCSGVCTDTREMKVGSMFFCLKGKNFNGNEFAREAIDKGAKIVVVDDVKFLTKNDKRFIYVENSLNSLVELAKYHRKFFKIPVIGITGSCGKTTTKELLWRILAKKLNVIYNSKSYNSIPGIPLTILKITEKTDIAIVEIGTNSPGEIAMGCNIAGINFGVITNVKPIHLLGLKNFNGVFSEKTDMYRYLSKNAGTVFVNKKNAQLLECAENLFKKENIVTYQNEKKNNFVDVLSENPYLKILISNGIKLQTNLIGEFHSENISLAIEIGSYFGIEGEKIYDEIKKYIPSNNRSQTIIKETNTIILDAYNSASIDSVISMIESFLKSPQKNKVLILGSIKEMADQTEEVHRRLGIFLKSLKNASIFLLGDEMKSAKKECGQANFFFDKKTLLDFLSKVNYDNTAFLIKGSRYWKLEEIVEVL